MTTFSAAVTAQNGYAGEEIEFFYKNPIIDNGADPWAYYKDGYYYYTHTTGGDITVWKSKTLSGVGSGQKKVVWRPEAGKPYSSDLWAPEIFFVDGKWYVYFAAGSSEHGFRDQKMWVLQSETDDVFSNYTLMGQIKSPDDNWAIDGSIFEYNDKLYITWSGEPTSENDMQCIYLAEMSNPWTISSERVLLSKPEYEWEQRGGRPWINEGPSALYKDGKIHIVYSASGSWSDFYCLGLLTFSGGDILSPDSWVKSDKPVFESGNGIFSPGHSSYVKSPDGTEDWIVYHSARSQGSGWDRVVRMQKFTWDVDGYPVFGEPLPDGRAYPLPSGEREQYDKIEGIIDGKTYRIRPRLRPNGTTHYLELVPDGDSYNLITSPWEDKETQQWIVTKVGTGTMTIKSLAEDVVLTIYENGNLTALDYREDENQQWNIAINSTGYFEVVSASGQGGLELLSEEVENGRKVGIDPTGGRLESRWKFEPMDELVEPTPTPTSEPTPTPTPSPSPTTEPTASPDPTESPKPTASPEPTESPDPTESPKPSDDPTEEPTDKPSSKPSTPTDKDPDEAPKTSDKGITLFILGQLLAGAALLFSRKYAKQ